MHGLFKYIKSIYTCSDSLIADISESFRCGSMFVDSESVYFIRLWTDDQTVRHCIRIKDGVTGVLLYQQHSLGIYFIIEL